MQDRRGAAQSQRVLGRALQALPLAGCTWRHQAWHMARRCCTLRCVLRCVLEPCVFCSCAAAPRTPAVLVDVSNHLLDLLLLGLKAQRPAAGLQQQRQVRQARRQRPHQPRAAVLPPRRCCGRVLLLPAGPQASKARTMLLWSPWQALLRTSWPPSAPWRRWCPSHLCQKGQRPP